MENKERSQEFMHKDYVNLWKLFDEGKSSEACQYVTDLIFGGALRRAEDAITKREEQESN